jgi:hypothetical protein
MASRSIARGMSTILFAIRAIIDVPRDPLQGLENEVCARKSGNTCKFKTHTCNLVFNTCNFVAEIGSFDWWIVEARKSRKNKDLGLAEKEEGDPMEAAFLLPRTGIEQLTILRGNQAIPQMALLKALQSIQIWQNFRRNGPFCRRLSRRRS